MLLHATTPRGCQERGERRIWIHAPLFYLKPEILSERPYGKSLTISVTRPLVVTGIL